MRDPPRRTPWEIILATSPQGVPHTVLLQRSFYDAKLLPPLTLWALLWLRRARVSHGTDEQLYNYLSSTPTSEGGGVWDTLVAQLPEEHVQLLNLADTWLSSVLPHVLCKVARVHYGLLPERDLLNTTPGDNLPQSRRLLAVPFIGKDVPSHAAEFSHPDALIGLTILAYRHEGLRRPDFVGLMKLMLETMEGEGGPFRDRPACRRYASWVELAGGRVRGLGTKTPRPGANMMISQEYDDLWPLQLVNPMDEQQMGVLYELLAKLPHAVQHYLEQLVFPLTMQHQSRRLSANGQDLGSASLFGCRLGFSGTPSDLLPTDFGACQYMRGDDAQMLSALTSPAVMSYVFVPTDWSVRALLDDIATAKPPYASLIDAGALVTGLTNEEVARYLLGRGLAGMEGVVFLDDRDRKMIMLRAGYRVLTLAGCGVAATRRFSFFDQAPQIARRWPEIERRSPSR